MMRKISVSLCLLITLSLSAANIAIINPSFDDQTIADTTWIGDIDGWVVSDNTAGLFNPGSQWFSAEAGNGTHKNTAFSNGGLIYQVLSATVASGTTYTLSVDVGARIATDFPGYTIRLMAAGQILATYSGTANSISEDSWETKTLVYTAGVNAPVGSSLEIHLSSNGVQTNFDNVSLSTDNLPCEVISGDVIKSNTTLYVSNLTGDFASIHEALNCLADKLIYPNATVTVQVANGVYSGLNTIFIEHPQSSQIQIVGNTGDPSLVRLEFNTNQNGFTLDSQKLKLITGLTLVGNSSDGLSGFGVFMINNAELRMEHVIIQTFAEGILLQYGPYLRADYVTATNCAVHSFSSWGARAYLTNCIFTNNGISGIAATLNSHLMGRYLTVSGNDYGTLISRNSALWAQYSNISGNNHNIYTTTGGQVTF